MIDRKSLFDIIRPMLLSRGATFTQAEIALIDAWFDKIDGPVPKVTPAPEAQGFKLSQASLNELERVYPALVRCVKKAITYTKTDFRVNQGLRTYAEQKAAVAAGHSRTMNSKHLPQADGLSHAVDLVAIVDGKVSWEFNVYADIAFAMDKAATELGIANHVRWGCAWDRVLSDFGGSASAYLAEAKAYADRHPGSDLLDAPHFEWV